MISKKINNGLYNYDKTILDKPQVIAANKIDCLTEEELEEELPILRKSMARICRFSQFLLQQDRALRNYYIR